MGYAENTEKLFPYFSWGENFFGHDFYQYNIRADLADTIPGDDIFLVRADQSAQSGRTGHNDGTDLTGTLINDQITDLPKLLAVTSVDHIFFF